MNTKKTAYVFLSRDQTAGQSHNIKMANKFFKNVMKFNYLGYTNIKIARIDKLRAGYILRIRATVWSRIVCLSIRYRIT